MKTLLNKNVPNIDQMEVCARDIAAILDQEDCFSVFLEGGLGAGKTFLVRTILHELGVKEEIPSPTYTYVYEYEAVARRVAHFDFYRLESPQEFFEKGFSDISEDRQISSFCEWHDKISTEAQHSFTGAIFLIRIEFGVGVGMRKLKFYRIDS